MSKTSKAAGSAKDRRRRTHLKSEARRVSFDFITPNGLLKVEVTLCLTALQPDASSLLAQMPPQIAVWPHVSREEWLQRYATMLEDEKYADLERRVVDDHVRLFASTLALGDQLARERANAMPRPNLKIIGGYEAERDEAEEVKTFDSEHRRGRDRLSPS